MKVLVAYAGPEGEAVDEVDVPAHATLAEAVDRSGIALRLALDVGRLAFAIHGQRAVAGTPLRDGDRVELLRPLVADPKDVRRRRAAENPLPRTRPTVGKRRTPP
jgi:putative ubiquitin-RnfH superfamily antitoxin RatB of RatAB toxin-antitoxin module